MKKNIWSKATSKATNGVARSAADVNVVEQRNEWIYQEAILLDGNSYFTTT